MEFEMLESVVRRFKTNGEVKSIVPFGGGHINDTYKVDILVDGKTELYILQRLNTTVFPRTQILMNNAVKVTEYMRELLKVRGGDVERGTLHFYESEQGTPYYIDEEKNWWRFEDFVQGTVSHDLASSPEMFEATGFAFGSFMSDLADFPAAELGEVIENFHNTRVRFQTFNKEVAADKSGRLDTCREEVAFAMARKDLTESIVTKLEDGSIPLRVTHNDTKINNILMDAVTDKPVCIIDLDTIMPGAACYDFGDSIRFGASSAVEDETDLSKVYMKLELFEAYARGFMKAMGKALNLEEARSLALGSMVITFENGIRFLGDYLNGDVYFKTKYPEHNLVRARTQFKLVADMEQKLPEMYKIVEKYFYMAQEA